jgi:hypothetical protein
MQILQQKKYGNTADSTENTVESSVLQSRNFHIKDHSHLASFYILWLRNFTCQKSGLMGQDKRSKIFSTFYRFSKNINISKRLNFNKTKLVAYKILYACMKYLVCMKNVENLNFVWQLLEKVGLKYAGSQISCFLTFQTVSVPQICVLRRVTDGICFCSDHIFNHKY